MSLFSVALAGTPAGYPLYNLVWESDFVGAANSLPNAANWNVINGGGDFNDEVEVYSNKPANVRFSGEGTLQLIPVRDASVGTGWTSGRIESKYTVTPTAGKITRVEALLRLAGTPSTDKQGIWPAFWMLGQSYRTGTAWPACGEVDIMENINGQAYGQGAAHCDVSPGGVCNEPSGLVNGHDLTDSDYHTWRVEFDRTNTNWKLQTITWFKDNVQFNQVTGAQIGTLTVWASLTQKPLYFILNVAVGGDWVSSPASG